MPGPIDYAAMARGLLGYLPQPVAMKNNPLSKSVNPMVGTEGARRSGSEGGGGVRVYKGMHPYDAKGRDITRIERDTEFPAFNRGEPGVKIGGFYTTDPAVASRFAKVLSEHGGAVYPANANFQRPHVIDAKGKPAGEIEFGPTGKAFRDAVRSGKYDGVIIKNTKDEGDVYVALGRGTIKSAIDGSTLFGAGAAGLLGLLKGAGGREEPLPPM
jgi:hypothetical protein